MPRQKRELPLAPLVIDSIRRQLPPDGNPDLLVSPVREAATESLAARARCCRGTSPSWVTGCTTSTRIINRTVVYGLLTALLGGIYGGLVLVLGQLFGDLGGRPSSWVVSGPPRR